MASITIVNKTNTPINSSLTHLGVNSSWRNKINENEFFVHSAGWVYNVNVRYYTSHESLYVANWGRIGEIIGEISFSLFALGLTIVGAGPAVTAAVTAWRAVSAAGAAAQLAARQAVVQAVRATGAAFATELGAKGAVIVAIDAAAIGMDAQDIARFEAPRDYEWTNVEGRFDNIFVVEGGAILEPTDDGSRMLMKGFKPLAMRKITQIEFDNMKKNNEVYELSERCHRIYFDSHRGLYYYEDPRGFRVYNPDSANEHAYNENGKRIPVPDVEPEEPDVHKWTKSAAHNHNGAWQKKVHVEKGTRATGIEVRVEPKYGLINARVLHHLPAKVDYDESEWTCENMGNNSPTNFTSKVPRHMDRIIAVEVLEQPGYGLVDLRCICGGQQGEAGCVCDWSVGNKDGVNRFRVELPEDAFLNGLRGKELGRYGLVDLKFAYAVEPKQSEA